ncbi:DUF4129 domain-containing protein [Ornithinibacillus gellani]|uniref:DUF4129 domain-containing protein n=1 Tax=Ornithinibacillus gellani TaxID=2293253 RepID=UPI000F494AC8|nr:DUF4129 domain-containing protein [Ornithinibacillus gellani]TQS74740.1 DUF4129 domain-containing protein [Ornithinibacillus gellani]
MLIAHPSISYAYHFLSEAILIFLIVLPFSTYFFESIPYWSYLVIAVFACFLLDQLTRRTNQYIYYLLIIPILGLVFYLFAYPVELIVLFSVVLPLRYIRIRKTEIVNRQNIYLMLTLCLTVFALIMVQQTWIMIFPFLQFLLIIIGNFLSHLFMVNKQDRKQFKWRQLIALCGIPAFGAVVFYLLFDTIRHTLMTVWYGIIYLFSNVMTFLGKHLSFIKIKPLELPDVPISDFGDEEIDKEETFEMMDGNENQFLYILLIIAVITIIAVVIYRLRKNAFSQIDSKADPLDVVHFEDIEKRKKGNHFFSNQWNKLYRPMHPARRLVQQFERTFAKHQLGRKHSETIEEWFERVGIHANMDLYERVRYGEQDITDEELQILKEELKRAKQVCLN